MDIRCSPISYVFYQQAAAGAADILPPGIFPTAGAFAPIAEGAAGSVPLKGGPFFSPPPPPPSSSPASFTGVHEHTVFLQSSVLKQAANETHADVPHDAFRCSSKAHAPRCRTAPRSLDLLACQPLGVCSIVPRWSTVCTSIVHAPHTML